MKTKSRNSVGADDILNDLQALATDTKRIFADSVQAPTAEVLAALRARLDDAQAHLAEYYNVAKEKTVAGAKATDRVIRDRPYQSIGVALGAGILIGICLTHRKD